MTVTFLLVLIAMFVGYLIGTSHARREQDRARDRRLADTTRKAQEALDRDVT